MMTVSQAFVFLLFADAAWVAYLIVKGKRQMPWVALYWILLTIKNFCDMMKW